jgi:hypothetical protein
MIRVISTFRIFDDANSTSRIYRPGNDISGADAEFALKNGFAEDYEKKADTNPENKALKSAPENKSGKA